MYYDSKNQILINKLPKNSIGPDGSFYIDFDQVNDINILASHNYLTVRNDTPSKPSDYYIEDVKERVITIDSPYVDVIRTWKIETDRSDI